MGISRLETFLEHNQPNDYCHEVNIEELARRYTVDTGRVPLMVVDGYNFMHTVAYKSGQYDWLMGGQFEDCISNIKHFIDRFKNIGVELMFYFTGATLPKKRTRWLGRKSEKLNKITNVFGHLKGNRTLTPQHLQSTLYHQPTLLGNVIMFVIKHACEGRARVAIDDLDLELTTYAKREKCFAILSQDTDYVVLEGAQYYLSGKHLNVETMTTLQYDGKAFAESFSLRFNQLPLLATLLGNDYLSMKTLTTYHSRVTKLPSIWQPGETRVLIKAIADYVRTLPTGDELIAMLPTVAAEHLQDSSLTEALQDGVKSYLASSLCNDSFNDIEDSNWKNILKCAQERHIQCEAHSTIYNLLTGLAFQMSETIEDLTNDKMPCSAVATKPLRYRIFAILLHEKPGDSVSVEEWCIYPHQDIQGEAVPVQDMPDGVHHPGLLALWIGSTPDIQTERWELFVQSASPGLDTAQVRGLPLQLVVPTLVLSYIRQECGNVFEDWEVDAILSLAVVRDSTDMAALSALPPTYRPPVRVVECSTLYCRVINTVSLLAAACGFPLQQMMPWHYFDGKLFLEKFLDASEGISIEALCNQQPVLVKKFLTMRNIVRSLPVPPRLTDQQRQTYSRQGIYPTPGDLQLKRRGPGGSYQPRGGYQPSGGYQPRSGYQPSGSYQPRGGYRPRVRHTGESELSWRRTSSSRVDDPTSNNATSSSDSWRTTSWNAKQHGKQ